MPTLSIRSVTHASNKAKVPTDERSHFFREQYKEHGLGFAGKKNLFGWEYTTVEGGNHHSRLALKKAFERLLEAPNPSEETDMVIIADYAFLQDGKEEERKLEKVGEKEKMVKVEVEREGIQKLLEEFGPKFRKITVLFEKSQEGPQDGDELDKHLQLVLEEEKSGKHQRVHVFHFQQEVTPSLYSRFVKTSAGMPS